MEVWDLLFGAGPAVKAIMRMGFMPKDEDFLELTAEQYEKFFEKEGYTEEKVFVLLPQDPRNYRALNTDELNICTESDIATIKRGWQIVESYCSRSNRVFLSDREKLAYAASVMPEVFSKETPFEYAHQKHLKIVYMKGEEDIDHEK